MRQNPETKPEAETPGADFAEAVDQELDAMKRIAAALEPLDEDGRSRVVQWAIERSKVRIER